MKILGIDLAGKTHNNTGIAVITGDTLYLNSVFTDRDLIKLISQYLPECIAIDAPLSLPWGRCCLEKECSCSKGGHFRQSDKEMRKYGGVLPLTFRGMKALTFRGLGLRKTIEKTHEDIKIIETHPRTSQKLFGLGKDNKKVFNYLKLYFKVNKKWAETNPHEIDAALAALTALFYISNRYKELGDAKEGTIIIPELKSSFEKEMDEILY